MAPLSRYASYFPLLKSIYAFHPFKVVLEIGMGKHSTPYFLNICEHLYSVEHDPRWADGYHGGDNHTVMMPNISTSKAIPNARRNLRSAQFKFFYHKLARKLASTLDLVFIDGMPIERIIALEAFYEKCDLILFHDYEAHDKNGIFEPYTNCDFFIDRTVVPNTALFTKKGLLDGRLLLEEFDRQMAEHYEEPYSLSLWQRPCL